MPGLITSVVSPGAKNFPKMKILFFEGKVAIGSDGMPAQLDVKPAGMVFTTGKGTVCHAVSTADAEQHVAAGGTWAMLREYHARWPEELWKAAAKGSELIYWDGHSRFCPVCASEMEPMTDISKKCPRCGYESWPAVSPAILVLVKRGEEALLVHAANFREGMHALVAGFVETGETLEECVAREVMEETSLRISDIRYFGSQSWPFPSQMMIAFTARYESGEIRFADGELTSGRFFTRENLPPLPSPPSLSRRLIDAWINREV